MLNWLRNQLTVIRYCMNITNEFVIMFFILILGASLLDINEDD